MNACVRQGRAGRWTAARPAPVFNTVNNRPRFLRAEGAVAGVHSDSRGNSSAWKPSASVYTRLVNIR